MLTVKSLSCRRGRHLVFRKLDFSIGAGGLLLVTGRNGSGKSSLLRVLAGLLPPDEGKLLWQKKPINDWAAHRARLHYIGHLDVLKPELTVDEMVRYWRVLYGVTAVKNSLPKLFGLGKLRDVPVRYLSAGQKRRLTLVRLTLRKAKLWLLDEPTTALDHEGQTVLHDLLAKHRARKGCAVIATHQKSDYADAQHLVLGENGK